MNYATQLLDLMVQMGDVARARYANGLAAQQDAVRAQVEQTAIKTGLVALNSSRRQVEARLNALLSRPANMPLAAPQGLRSIPATATPENQAALEQRVPGQPALRGIGGHFRNDRGGLHRGRNPAALALGFEFFSRYSQPVFVVPGLTPFFNS